jgi:hypothetical protein
MKMLPQWKCIDLFYIFAIVLDKLYVAICNVYLYGIRLFGLQIYT